MIGALRAFEQRLGAIEGALGNLDRKAAANTVTLGEIGPVLKGIEDRLVALQPELYRSLRDDLYRVRNDLWRQLDDLEREAVYRALGEYLDRRFSRLEADLYLMHLRDLNRYLLDEGRITPEAFQSTLELLNRFSLDDSREPVSPLQKLAETIRRKPDDR